MSQHLENYGFHCYRLTRRNASSGAANGLLTQIKNGNFRAVFIHMPVKKKDIRENKYHAHLLTLASWTRQAHANVIPVLWIGPFGNAWNELDIRNMQNELKLFVTYFRFCNLQISCRSLEPHQASGTCIVIYSSHKLTAAQCRCEKGIEHVLCWYQATQNHRRHAWQRFLTARFAQIVGEFGILVAFGKLKSPGNLGLQATPDYEHSSKPEGQDDLEQNQSFGVLSHKPKGNNANALAPVVSASADMKTEQSQSCDVLNSKLEKEQEVNEQCLKTAHSVHQSTRAFPTESKERAKARKLAGHIARARNHQVEERYDDVGKDFSRTKQYYGR